MTLPLIQRLNATVELAAAFNVKCWPFYSGQCSAVLSVTVLFCIFSQPRRPTSSEIEPEMYYRHLLTVTQTFAVLFWGTRSSHKRCFWRPSSFPFYYFITRMKRQTDNSKPLPLLGAWIITQFSPAYEVTTNGAIHMCILLGRVALVA